MKKARAKFYTSPHMIALSIYAVVFALGVSAFLLFPLLTGAEGYSKKIIIQNILISSFLILTVIISFIGNARKAYTLVEISETGVKSSLFKVFRIFEMSWDEIAEIRCYGLNTNIMFFSAVSLAGMTYNEIIKRNDVILLRCNEDTVPIVRLFTEQEIIDLPERLGKKGTE